MGHHRPEYSHHEDPHHVPPHHEDPHHRPVHHGGGHHSKCFIATAVHGENSIEVFTLRSYRDDILTTSAIGRAFVAAYTKMSPPLASFIADKPSLRSLARRVIVTPAYRVAKRYLPPK